MISVGIDASVSSTGIVVLASSGEKIPTLLLEKTLTPGKLKGMPRHQKLVTGIMEIIHEHKPDKIVIEGYSLNMKNASSVIPLVELGGLLRFCMWLDGLTWLAPRATELKKFVIGKGVGTKDQVQMFVLHRWGHMAQNNDTADGYGLACMGLAHANKLPGITKEARAVVGALKLQTE